MSQQDEENPEMSDCLYEIHGIHDVIRARATGMPLGALSCPYSQREVGSHEAPRPHRSFRSFGPGHRATESRCGARDLLTTDHWNPPVGARQLALAFILAAVLAQAGW